MRKCYWILETCCRCHASLSCYGDHLICKILKYPHVMCLIHLTQITAAYILTKTQMMKR